MLQPSSYEISRWTRSLSEMWAPQRDFHSTWLWKNDRMTIHLWNDVIIIIALQWIKEQLKRFSEFQIVGYSNHWALKSCGELGHLSRFLCTKCSANAMSSAILPHFTYRCIQCLSIFHENESHVMSFHIGFFTFC